MRMPSLRAIAVAAAVVAAVAVAVTTSAALADKVVTVRSAPSEVLALEFRPQPGGSVRARVCGRSQFPDGGLTTPTCYEITLSATDPIAIDVNALATGQARTFWMNQEGL